MEKSVTMDTRTVSRKEACNWLVPPFQRPLRVNGKVLGLAERIKADGGVIPGVITLGVVSGKKIPYIIDGQHRIEAFKLSEVPEAYVDLRVLEFSDLGDMGQEFVNLNSRLVTMRPDDVLRGMEAGLPALAYIRQHCPIVGYGQIHRNETTEALSMSVLLRAWFSSGKETPGSGAENGSVANIAQAVTMDAAKEIADTVKMLERAWGRNLEYARLWNGLNLTICFWLYRRLVLGHANKMKRVSKVTKNVFELAMTSLSASKSYLDWLVGRRLTQRDRGPCMSKIRTIVAKRMLAETGVRPLLPLPSWCSGFVRS